MPLLLNGNVNIKYITNLTKTFRYILACAISRKNKTADEICKEFNHN